MPCQRRNEPGPFQPNGVYGDHTVKMTVFNRPPDGGTSDRVGETAAVADVALLELREGNFDFLDNCGNKVPGRQRLFPSGTVLAGKAVLGGKRIARS